MKKTVFAGSATALVTPMKEDLSIDFDLFGTSRYWMVGRAARMRLSLPEPLVKVQLLRMKSILS